MGNETQERLRMGWRGGASRVKSTCFHFEKREKMTSEKWLEKFHSSLLTSLFIFKLTEWKNAGLHFRVTEVKGDENKGRKIPGILLLNHLRTLICHSPYQRKTYRYKFPVTAIQIIRAYVMLLHVSKIPHRIKQILFFVLVNKISLGAGSSGLQHS